MKYKSVRDFLLEYSKDGDCCLSFDELISGFERARFNVTREECGLLFAAVDANANSQLSYTELVSLCGCSRERCIAIRSA